MMRLSCLLFSVALRFSGAEFDAGDVFSKEGQDEALATGLYTLYESVCGLDATFTTESGQLLSTSDVYGFETITAKYIEDLLSISQVIDHNVLRTSVDVQDQIFSGDITLRSTFAMTYVNEEGPVADLSDILSEIVWQEQSTDMLEVLKKDGSAPADAAELRLSFIALPADLALSSISVADPMAETDKALTASKKNPLTGWLTFLVLCLLCMCGLLLHVTNVVDFGKATEEVQILFKRTFSGDDRSEGDLPTPRLGAKPTMDEDEENHRPTVDTTH